MTQLLIKNRCKDYNSYRCARVKSLFNAETGAVFETSAEIPEGEWSLGVIVGPSGSGKTSIGRKVFGGGITDLGDGWNNDDAIIDCIGADRDFDEVTGALSAVGLGSVPSWLKPYHVLSNGEKFRAGLARVLCSTDTEVCIDEFTSVVDRQIAKIGSLAFAKAWRRKGGRCVLLSCHYDILDWLEPDWVFDTARGQLLSGRSLWQRPKFELDTWEVNGSYWPRFEPHHYLKIPRMIAATYYVGAVGGEPVAHLAVSPHFHCKGRVRACRLVIMPEWQGAGVGTRFLDGICEMHLQGENRWKRKAETLFHTSHPGLCAALKRSKRWRRISGSLFGGNKAKSGATLARSKCRGSGFGGHFRAVSGFLYVGEG